jgi:hypothetical protein
MFASWYRKPNNEYDRKKQRRSSTRFVIELSQMAGCARRIDFRQSLKIKAGSNTRYGRGHLSDRGLAMPQQTRGCKLLV